MPQIAMATSSVVETDEEASTTRVDDLIQRGRSQGHLSLAELRNAFDQAGLTPAEGNDAYFNVADSSVDSCRTPGRPCPESFPTLVGCITSQKNLMASSSEQMRRGE